MCPNLLQATHFTSRARVEGKLPVGGGGVRKEYVADGVAKAAGKRWVNSGEENLDRCKVGEGME